MLPPLLIIFLLSCLLLSLDDAILLEELFNVGAFDFAEGLLDGHLSMKPISMSVAFLPSRSLTVALSRSRTSYTLPQTSGTPRSTFSSV